MEFACLRPILACLLAVVLSPCAAQAVPHEAPARCAGRTVTAQVVALDQPFSWNRFGALQPHGMIYALRRDVVSMDSRDPALKPGEIALRRDKRPRPLTLRVNEGDCLRIRFTNLLASRPKDEQQPATRAASVHVVGLELVESIRDDGSYVGRNENATVEPGGSIDYYLYGAREGTYVLHSMGALVGGEGDSGSIAAGLFGAVHVEPRGSEWYRSQVTRADLALASETAGGFPRIRYDAVYPPGHRHAGLPILRMLQGDEIVHSDLTAIITGPNAGRLANPLPNTGLYPDRDQPYREFTVIFHDEIGAVQAFPHFEDEVFEFPMHGTRDAFAINYGTGGIGAEILANRLGVGPAHDCAECKYEEFFLSSWVLGDPAMVVDVPANAPCRTSQLREGRNCVPKKGPKATRAFFPDDPSNVYHSYLNDHVKFRNLHAGSDDHHIFHLHTHQWTHTPESDLSAYLDSQAIGQGGAFTYEIAYGGSGNRNRTPGDAIFHCHFYPHFAQGMWALWRVHDVLELGTELDGQGRPRAGSRALPDGEIVRGTPIPAVVPLPTLAMAPLPGPVRIVNGEVRLPDPLETHPGYPFFIPGRAGRRPPHPPLDTVHDGGLPRHVVRTGEATSMETRHDFSKIIDELEVEWLAEAGEPVERLAMELHAEEKLQTPTPGGGTGEFRLNGRPAAPGAPFADPCPADAPLRYYRAADIQIDAVLNKAGWHFPQQRISALWNDVERTLSGKRPPEPLFFRAESGDCVEFWLTNLVPAEYELDDFQVRTPTDILGQHIHLVKFDVTSSDGSANGFNYEDGSFSPEEVQERIHAIRVANRCDVRGAPASRRDDRTKCPVAERHPFFQGSRDVDCDGIDDWLGAQTTVQRWWADPIPITRKEEDAAGRTERTLRTVFTHDHFGPSTHQQTGLYSGLVVEPKETTWYHNEIDLLVLSPRVTDREDLTQDGGPTSWQARVVGRPDRPEDTYREFMVAGADFQPAYMPGGPVCPDRRTGGLGFAAPDLAVNPPGRKLVGPPVLYEKPDVCPTNEDDPDGPLRRNRTGLAPPCAELVGADDFGMTAVNYRNEPIALRILDPSTGRQASGEAGDLSFAYQTRDDRADPAFNIQPDFYPPLTRDLEPGDPYTPLFRVKEGDPVHIRVLVGAHEEEHNFSVHGIKWLAEPDYPESGLRNSQMMGISEWFDFEVPRVPSLGDGEQADFLYKPASATEWQWTGAWGLLRVYKDPASRIREERAPGLLDLPDLPGEEGGGADPLDLPNLPVNPDGRADGPTFATVRSDMPEGQNVPEASFETELPIACPPMARKHTYRIAAVSALEVLAEDPDPVRGLVYNQRSTRVKTFQTEEEKEKGIVEPGWRSGPLHDPTAILFVHESDLVLGSLGRPVLCPGVRREPLVLRAQAGECIEIHLRNALPAATYRDLPGWNAMPMIVEGFNANDVRPSLHVGLHPQLVFYDVRHSDGVNVGTNPRQTAAPGETVTYHWYAGDITDDQGAIPIEFGATGLSSSDPIKHTNKGAVGALIIEPEGATWLLGEPDGNGQWTRASTTVAPRTGAPFREFVLVFQDDVNLRYADGAPVESLAVAEDATESGQKAINYRAEPIWFRIGVAPDWPVEGTRKFELFHKVLSNRWTGRDPETPVFEIRAGKPARFRVVHPGGHTQSHVFTLHGHVWQELPYVQDEVQEREFQLIPRNTRDIKYQRLGDNPESEWKGARGGHGPTNHFDVLLDRAGGTFSIVGDYLYWDYPSWFLDAGIWGLLRVLEP